MTRISLERLIFLGLGLTILLYPFIYWGHYAGDAIIHLVFGENAAQGHLFEFNLGEKSSGESSVGFMLLIALLFRMLTPALVPIAVKIINYSAWLLLLFTFYRILKFKQFNKYIIASALFAVGLLPGSVYNSMNGMENVLLGLFTVLWFYFAIKHSYFTLNSVLSRKIIFLEIIFSFILGIATWVRPESLPFFAVALGARFLAVLYYKQSILPISVKTVIAIVAFALPTIALSLFIHWQTDEWIQSSVIARSLLGGITSYHIGPVIFDPKMLIRLMCYFPITFFWMLGVIHFFKYDWRNKVDEFFAITLFISVIFMFTFISGVIQLSRYMIFITPFWILIAARGVECASSFYTSFPRVSTLSICASILALATVYGVETKERFGLQKSSTLLTIIHAPENRQKQSDAIYAEMGRPKLPIILAGGEVDVRYSLDNRFIIRCLDGRIDSALLKYFHKSSIDYVNYFKERAVTYFMIDYSIPSYQDTLPAVKLQKLNLRESIDLAGLRITYIGTDYSIFKIVQV